MAGLTLPMLGLLLAISCLNANPIRMASQFARTGSGNADDDFRQMNFNPLAPPVRSQMRPVSQTPYILIFDLNLRFF